MKPELRSVPKRQTARPGTDTHTRTGFFSPHLLENLNRDLGEPRWFWPSVAAFMFALFALGSSVASSIDEPLPPSELACLHEAARQGDFTQEPELCCSPMHPCAWVE